MSSGFNGLLFGTELLLVPLAISMYIAVSGDAVRRLVGAQVAGLIGSLMLVLLSIVFATEAFADLGIAAALLGIGGGITYAHFLERWL